MKSSKNLRGFLQGMQFYFKQKGFKINVYGFAQERIIIKDNYIRPNFTLDVEGFNIFVNCFNDYQNMQLIVKLSMNLNHTVMLDTAKQFKKNINEQRTGKDLDKSPKTRNLISDFDDRISDNERSASAYS